MNEDIWEELILELVDGKPRRCTNQIIYNI